LLSATQLILPKLDPERETRELAPRERQPQGTRFFETTWDKLSSDWGLRFDSAFGRVSVYSKEFS
jgi:hypothetical protein